MLESQRVELLSAMGVKAFHPRFQLAAAKPSIQLPKPVSSAAVVATDSPVLQSSQSDPVANIPVRSGSLVEQAQQILQSQQVAGMQAALSDAESASTQASSIPSSLPQIDVGVSKAAKQLSVTENDVDTDSETKALRFRQRLIRVGEYLMLLDQPALEWQDEKAAQQFFADIYFALHKKRPEFYASDIFEWPPAKNFPNAHDVNLAKSTLSGFLQRTMSNPECQFLICWGINAATYLIDKPAVGQLSEYRHRPLLVADELSNYWQHPARKRLLWADLQSLNAVAATSSLS